MVKAITKFWFNCIRTYRTLAIESSCDDSCIAIVKFINNEFSSEEVHDSHTSINRAFEGVFPFLMSTCHEISLARILKKSLGCSSIAGIDSVSYTTGPGIFQCLSRGQYLARILGAAFQIPIIPVHHMEGHIHSAEHMPIGIFPFLSVLISGGHTLIVLVEGFDQYTVISKSLDDNIGETYDKIAREIPFELRGPKLNGSVIEAISESCPCSEKDYFNIDNGRTCLDFSFSGIKAEVIKNIRSEKRSADDVVKIVCKFQRTIESYLEAQLKKCLNILATIRKQPLFITVGGGVSVNNFIRNMLTNVAREWGVQIYFPTHSHSTDNASMIGKVGIIKYLHSKNLNETFPIPEFPLGFLKDDDMALDCYKLISTLQK